MRGFYPSHTFSLCGQDALHTILQNTPDALIYQNYLAILLPFHAFRYSLHQQYKNQIHQPGHKPVARVDSDSYAQH